jgi:hypothetical protein
VACAVEKGAPLDIVLRVRKPELVPRLRGVLRRCQAEAAAIGGAGGEEGWVGEGTRTVTRRGCEGRHLCEHEVSCKHTAGGSLAQRVHAEIRGRLV